MKESADVVAADLGASSARVLVGHVGAETLNLTEVLRVPNVPVAVVGTLYWDVLRLYRSILEGVCESKRFADDIVSVGIDAWGVDYGLLDRESNLLGNPIHYRDDRTRSSLATVLSIIREQDLYEITGAETRPATTLCQMMAARDQPQTSLASQLLLMPDLISYWLTGIPGAELTQASTTQLLDVQKKCWAGALMRKLGMNPGLFAELRQPGEFAGNLTQEVLSATGLTAPVAATTVGSHDTASAVVAVPTNTPNFAYISCGTWAPVGLEIREPILIEESRIARFSNELGLDGTVRYLRNAMGLWLLQETIRVWRRLDKQVDLDAALNAAASVPRLRAVVDTEDPVFFTPGDMPSRIAQQCMLTGQEPPVTPAEIIRCIFDSLALTYRAALVEVQQLSRRHVDVLHIVGGGSRFPLLCQTIADASGLPVVAGPAEATALGNILIQARAVGALEGELCDLRRLVRSTQTLNFFQPSSSFTEWEAAARRIRS